MRSDRYTKVVLTIIAVALCVIAVPRLETSEVMAASGQPEAVAAVDPQQTDQDLSPIPPSVAQNTSEFSWREHVRLSPLAVRSVKSRSAWAIDPLR